MDAELGEEAPQLELDLLGSARGGLMSESGRLSS